MMMSSPAINTTNSLKQFSFLNFSIKKTETLFHDKNSARKSETILIIYTKKDDQ